MKIYVHRKTCMWLFTASLFIRIKIWKQLKYSSVGEWIHGLGSPHDGMLTAITRNRVGYTLNTSESWMHYERSQTQKVYLLYSSSSLSFWKGKPWRQKIDQSLPGTGGRRRSRPQRGTGEFSDRNIWYLEYGGSYVCQTHRTVYFLRGWISLYANHALINNSNEINEGSCLLCCRT